jgi:hypothetical protein
MIIVQKLSKFAVLMILAIVHLACPTSIPRNGIPMSDSCACRQLEDAMTLVTAYELLESDSLCYQVDHQQACGGTANHCDHYASERERFAD